jgi:phosphopantothenoylcysteine decarboxylase / phosphopantothenate---cysteine ligase
MSTRRLLVTAGPTWAPIDAVRHLANFSSGRMGATLARAAAAAGWAVTLLYGPGRHPLSPEDRQRMEVLDFITFEELHGLVQERVRSQAYAGMIHAAAVSDYLPADRIVGKMDSGASELFIRLVRAPKIIEEIKQLDPPIVLAAFKLTSGQTREEMLRAAQALMQRSGADLVVANDQETLSQERHPTVLLNESGTLAEAETPEALADPLLAAIASRAQR